MPNRISDEPRSGINRPDSGSQRPTISATDHQTPLTIGTYGGVIPLRGRPSLREKEADRLLLMQQNAQPNGTRGMLSNPIHPPVPRSSQTFKYNRQDVTKSRPRREPYDDYSRNYKIYLPEQRTPPPDVIEEGRRTFEILNAPQPHKHPGAPAHRYAPSIREESTERSSLGLSLGERHGELGRAATLSVRISETRASTPEHRMPNGITLEELKLAAEKICAPVSPRTQREFGLDPNFVIAQAEEEDYIPAVEILTPEQEREKARKEEEESQRAVRKLRGESDVESYRDRMFIKAVSDPEMHGKHPYVDNNELGLDTQQDVGV